MGNYISTAAKVVSGVANTVVSISNSVENAIEKNSPIYAYGMYFDDIYSIFLYDVYLDNLKIFFDDIEKKLNDKNAKGEKEEIDKEKLIQTILLLENLNLNILFLKKIITYSEIIKKTKISDDKVKIDGPLITHRQFLTRLYVINLTIEKLHLLHFETFKEFMIPEYKMAKESAMIEECKKIFNNIINYHIKEVKKIKELENKDDQLKRLLDIKEKTNMFDNEVSLVYRFIDNVFNDFKKKEKSDMKVIIDGVLGVPDPDAEVDKLLPKRQEYRSYFIEFDKRQIVIENNIENMK